MGRLADNHGQAPRRGRRRHAPLRVVAEGHESPRASPLRHCPFLIVTARVTDRRGMLIGPTLRSPSSSYHCGRTPIKVDRRPCDEARALGNQEGHQVGKLLGFADPTQGNLALLRDLAKVGVEISLRIA